MNKQILPVLRMVICFLAFTLTLNSCKTTKVIDKKVDEKSEEYLLSKLTNKEINFDWFTSKAKIKYKDDNTGITVTSTIKMKKDSLVWMNVKKFGLEVARVMITPDSVYVMDRFNREYYVEDIGYVERLYNIPSDLSTIQNILMGKAVILTKDNLSSKTLPDAYIITANDQKLENEYWLDNTTLLLKKMLLKDRLDKRTINLDLQEYDALNEQQKFSYLRKLNMNSQETGNVDVEIKFSNVKINVPDEIRFEIPKRYTRVN